MDMRCHVSLFITLMCDVIFSHATKVIILPAIALLGVMFPGAILLNTTHYYNLFVS